MQSERHKDRQAHSGTHRNRETVRQRESKIGIRIGRQSQRQQDNRERGRQRERQAGRERGRQAERGSKTEGVAGHSTWMNSCDVSSANYQGRQLSSEQLYLWLRLLFVAQIAVCGSDWLLQERGVISAAGKRNGRRRENGCKEGSRGGGSC